MTITFPLQPEEESKLFALAEARGISTEALVREAIEKFLAGTPETDAGIEPTRSSRGILPQYGAPPGQDEINANGAGRLANFARD